MACNLFLKIRCTHPLESLSENPGYNQFNVHHRSRPTRCRSVQLNSVVLVYCQEIRQTLLTKTVEIFANLFKICAFLCSRIPQIALKYNCNLMIHAKISARFDLALTLNSIGPEAQPLSRTPWPLVLLC